MAEQRFKRLNAIRPKPDWLPRASLGLGIGSTIAMNVAAGSRGGVGGAAIGALIPVAFVLALETLIWLFRAVIRLPWGWLWCLGAGLPMLGLAAITGIVSYLHALTVVTWTGSTGAVAHLIPLVPDQLILTGSAALMAVALAGKDKAAGKGEGAEPARARVTETRREAPRQQPHAMPARPGPARKTSGRRGGDTTKAVRVADLIKDLPPERVAQLAEMSKRDLAAELGVTPWAAESWKRKQANGHAPAGVGS